MGKCKWALAPAVWALFAATGLGADDPATIPTMPRTAAPSATGDAVHASCQVEGTCGKGCAGARLQRLWSWLSYRPSRSSTPCCQAEPCCRPPLYAFFLHRCRAASCAPPDYPPALLIHFSYTDLLRNNGDCLPPPCTGCR